MRDHVARLAPEEACGLLIGKDGRVEACIPVTNELHSPVRFRMDPREQLSAFHKIEHDGLDLLAIYHSHPQGPGWPSPTDLDEFYYPGILSVIWWRQDVEWDMRVFDLGSNPVLEFPVEVVEEEE